MFKLGIETYLAVVNAGSMSSAAQQLNCAQTTVSKRIKTLEDDMGMTLFERGKGHRTLRLTPAGEEFFKLALQWSAILKEARILKSQGPALSLVIGAVDSMNAFILPPVFRALQAHRPALNLEIRTLHSEEMYSLVENHHLDVAFTLRQRSHASVMVERFFSSPMVVLRPLAGKRRGWKPTVSAEDLDPRDELFIPWGQTFENWHDRWWDATAPARIRIDSMSILMAMLHEKNQWAMVPEWVAHIAPQREEFVVQRMEQNPPDYVCYRLTNKHPGYYAAQALAFLSKYCAQTLTSNVPKPEK